jgi:hypothetical protein
LKNQTNFAPIPWKRLFSIYLLMFLGEAIGCVGAFSSIATAVHAAHRRRNFARMRVQDAPPLGRGTSKLSGVVSGSL